MSITKNHESYDVAVLDNPRRESEPKLLSKTPSNRRAGTRDIPHGYPGGMPRFRDESEVKSSLICILRTTLPKLC